MKTKAIPLRTLGILFCLVFFFCTPFPDRYENIQENVKIRPFAIVCEPPEAAPGDTVTVRLFCYIPAGENPGISWKLARDYGTDLYGSEYERNAVSLDSLMLPGGRPDSFRFVVPESSLLYSAEAALLLRNPLYNPGNYTVAQVDSVLKLAAAAGILPGFIPPPLAAFMPELPELAVDNIACRVRLRARVQGNITLDVTKLLRIRYSGKFPTFSVNRNPDVRWMGIAQVSRQNLYGPDSIPLYDYKIHYLYNLDHPDSVTDTIVIDSGYSYFVIADTLNGGGGAQKYRYFSFRDTVVKTDSEEVNFSWFYTNEDFQPGMVMDSLILLMGQGFISSAERLMTPVDTAMHRFTLYAAARDFRWNDFLCTTGEALVLGSGYFAYTPAYARSMHFRPVAVSVGN